MSSSSSSPSSSSSCSRLSSPAQPGRRAWRPGSAADVLASSLWREAALGVPGSVGGAGTVLLDRLGLALEVVLAHLRWVVLSRVRDGVAVVGEGFLPAQLSEGLCLVICSLLHLWTGAGDGRGLWVMRARTGGVRATEGLRGIVVMATVVKKLSAGGVCSR